MAMAVNEIREWLNTLNDDDMVGINDDGLALEVVGEPGSYCEIGGIPLDDEVTDG